MLVRLKNTVRALLATAGVVGLALSLTACDSSAAGVFSASKCPSEEEVYQFARDISSYKIAPDPDRVRSQPATRSDVLGQMSEYVDPSCLEDMKSLHPRSSVGLRDNEDESKIDQLALDSEIKMVCEEAHEANADRKPDEFGYGHAGLVYLSVLTYLAGGPLYFDFACSTKDIFYLIGDEPTTPVKMHYSRFADYGVEAGVLTG